MRSDTVIDYAVFQLTPRRSRCELFVSSAGNAEKLASGLVKPFVSHLKVAEEQVALAVHSIKLEVQRHRNAECWFTKGTLERFVRFVSTPEVLELVNTFEAEMSQLEAARKIYSEGTEELQSDKADSSGAMTAADPTKKELLRAIDLRLAAVGQDLITAGNRASAAGFNHDTVSELWQFADCFRAYRLKEACTKFIALCQRRPDLMSQWRLNLDDKGIRASWGSDMSVDEPSEEQAVKMRYHETSEEQPNTKESEHHEQERTELSVLPPCNQNEKDQEEQKVGASNEPSSIQVSQPARRLSVQDKISLFENKQKENSNSGGKPMAVGKSVELRRLSSDVSTSMSLEKAVLRRWSGASDMSIDLGGDKKDNACDSPSCTPTSISDYVGVTSTVPQQFEDEKQNRPSVAANSLTNEQKNMTSSSGDPELKDHGDVHSQRSSLLGKEKLGINSVGDEERNAKITYGLDSDLQAGGISDKLGNANTNGESNHMRGDIMSEGIYEETEVDQFASQSQRRSFTRATEDVQIKEQMASSGMQPVSARISQKMRSEKPISAGSEQMKNSHDRTSDEVGSIDEISTPALPSNSVSEYQENMRLTDTSSMKQVQRGRQPKGNQELNDELKMKANELEKLFAEQMLRAPADQSGSARRVKPADKQSEQAAVSAHKVRVARQNTPTQRTLSSNEVEKFETPPTKKMVDDRQCDTSMKQKILGRSLSDDSKGKFYEEYMQKRDAKLREDWSSSGAEREAKLKAMQDVLDRSRSEMKAKFSGSTGRLSRTPQRADKVVSLSSKSSTKKDQHPISSFRNEDDDDSSRSTQTKKLQPKKDAPSLTPRSIGQPISRFPAKVSITSTAKRRSEKQLAQSVPNFSDFKKENTKPSPGVSKTAVRSQAKSTIRNNSTTDDAPLLKEEKPPRPTSLRKKSAVPVDTAKLSTMNSEENVSAPSKLGNDIARLKLSGKSENLRDEDEWGESALESEDSVELVKEEMEEEDLEIMQVETCVELDDEKPRMSQDSETSVESEVEIGNSTRTLSQVSPVSLAELPAATKSRQTVASLLDSPEEERPVPWNAPMNHPFSYPNETSDIDVSADSPVGSPAFWNFHSLMQAEVDTAQTSKKWGNAQKRATGNSSQSHTRKDMTKGFKRLLKFGRKTRGTDSGIDWISATTSEGDDDPEDGRDPSNRSSDDLRKSRMGFLQSHPSDDSFNETELFSEQVQTSNRTFPAPPANFKLKDDQFSGNSVKTPRSFFSLSNFRSKGSDSKLR